MRLRDLQTAFSSALSREADDTFMACIASGSIGRDERLSVYRNNMHHNHGEALRAVYPVVERLVGEDFFRYAADRYMERYPSTSGDIHGFGDQFARFLLEFPPAAQLAYLPDVARLEWAMHAVFHASDHAPLSLDRLQAIPQTDYAALRFALHPACRLLSSPFPVHTIWKMNQPSADWDGVLDIGGEGAAILVRRGSDFMVELAPLATAEFSMLSSLAQGDTLGAAYAAALEDDECFDLSRFLLRHVTEGSIVDLHPGADVTKK